MYRFSWFLLLILLADPLSAAEQQGVIVREARVYAEPGVGARQVGTIRAGTRVNLFGRKGGWEEIFAEREEIIGWIRSYQVRAGDYAPQVEAGTEPDSRGFLSGLAVFSRKASRFFSGDEGGSSSGTATIGVRGLSEAEIKSAKPNAAEFARMQEYASNKKRSKRFTKEGQLKAQKVKHIKVKNDSDK